MYIYIHVYIYIYICVCVYIYILAEQSSQPVHNPPALPQVSRVQQVGERVNPGVNPRGAVCLASFTLQAAGILPAQSWTNFTVPAAGVSLAQTCVPIVRCSPLQWERCGRCNKRRYGWGAVDPKLDCLCRWRSI